MKWMLALLGLMAAACCVAAPRTVCTITVNSEDEREALRRQLPAQQYRFVELVERGRPDWLANACEKKVSCDVLVVSGHFDGGKTFFSDRLDADEHLTVSELERVSCSGSCPALFSRLKEVYLFGCNTLNPTPHSSAYAEVVRSLVNEGHSRAQITRELAELAATGGESSRDRMRLIFPAVPVIYGFSATAPVGAVAGPVLERYLRQTRGQEVGRGQSSARLLSAFAPFGMTSTHGVTATGPLADTRADMCQFADERLSVAQRLSFVHELLQRDAAEPRLYLDRIEALRGSLDPSVREQPDVARVLTQIEQDAPARERILAYARQTDNPEARLRMLNLARDAGWLSEAQRRAELQQMLADLHARAEPGISDVSLACSLNRSGEFDDLGRSGVLDPAAGTTPGHMALRACLGSAADQPRVIDALLGDDPKGQQAARAYLRQRAIADVAERRRLAERIAALDSVEAQVRALDVLGRNRLSDPQVLGSLVTMYANATSAQLQAAVARVLIRAERSRLASADLLRTLRTQRLPDASDTIIDALIRVVGARRAG